VNKLQLTSPDQAQDIEEGSVFAPRFDAAGLIPAIVTDAGSKAVLMFAYMNREALVLSLETGFVHFYSRSRKSLWKKGETSGQTMSIVSARTDCDQDVILLEVEVGGKGAACHTGRSTCFYRQITATGELVTIDDERLIDPEKTYGKPVKE
jgi:phosphoribosyl-AMP cyclohydrolase